MSLTHTLSSGRELTWIREPTDVNIPGALDASVAGDIDTAASRLDRFAPWVARQYPETATRPHPAGRAFRAGIIESALESAEDLKDYISAVMGQELLGDLWLKRDDALPVSGSIKARGGIHEVFRLAEQRDTNAREDTKLVVASTGNLGLSIGTVGPALGFATEVHMSTDAQQWKKDLLRSRGAIVVEHDALFTPTVEATRAAAAADPNVFFIDDENSPGLFTGYAVAGQRLKAQFDALGMTFSPAAPLIVYLPCGVGGGPGGVTFGLKMAFGNAVHCHVIEPVNSPCMTLGFATGGGGDVSCADYGLSGHTVADGLAVQRPSPFVVKHAADLFSGFHTLEDMSFLASVNLLERAADIVVEPSAAAGVTIPWRLPESHAPTAATHLVWLTGGSLIPDQDEERLRGQAATAALQWRQQFC